MIKVWGRLNSINVQKVVWCLDELGLPFERCEAGGAFGVVDTPDYRRLNPNGLVPTVEDDGFVLWESNAIVRYLATKHGALWPVDLRGRAEADRWMDWQATAATPAMRDVFWQLIRTPAAERDAAATERSRAGSEAAAAILDAHLAGRAYVTGDAISVADIALGAHAHRWFNMPLKREPRPAMQAWYERLRARPGAARILTMPVT